METTKKCVPCDLFLSKNDNFCWLCGCKAVEVLDPTCICGKKLTVTDSFCGQCGKITQRGIFKGKV